MRERERERARGSLDFPLTTMSYYIANYQDGLRAAATATAVLLPSVFPSSFPSKLGRKERGKEKEGFALAE